MNQVNEKTERQKKVRFYLSALLAIAAALGCIYIYNQGKGSFFSNIKRDNRAEISSSRKWAEKIELPGLPNFYKVSDNLYRGAQPTKEGFEQLKNLGIKTIINLRSSDFDREETGDKNFDYEHIDMKAWDLKDKKVISFLQIITDKSKQPAFIHCRYGADRTGAMCAIFRIAIQGWSKEQAIKEMTKGGFGFNKTWGNLITYINNIDIEEIKNIIDIQTSIPEGTGNNRP